jgi:type I restriction enzyme S subunit
MSVRPGYRQTDIGPIPEAWDVQPLAARGAFAKGSGVRKDQANSGTLPCIRYGELYTHHHEIVRSFPSKISAEVARAARRLSPGDIVFAGSGETKEEIGKCAAFVDHVEAYAGGDTIIFSPRRDDPLFLGYALNQPIAVRHKAARGQGDAVVHISARALGDLRLPFPPLPEQRAIAAALGDVDALLAGLDRLIAKKRDLKQAAMQQLLTGQTRLPGFTGEWEVKRLGDHVRFLRNGVNSRAELQREGHVKYLHYGDIHTNKGAFMSPTALPSLSVEKAASLDRLRDGDLVFADASEDLAGVSKSVEMRGVGTSEVVSGQHTIAARFDRSVLADGFKGLLQFCPTFAAHLRRLAAGTKVYATNRAHIATAEVPLPNPDEQTAIAIVLFDMDAELDALEQRRAKTAALKEGMMQELLTGRTRLV